ncbi:MAG: hypothetical protein ACI4UE_06460 [Candidatus Scatovivens sp.]
MKKNLYKKYQKKIKLKDNSNPNYTIERSSNMKAILSFISDLISNLVKIIFYILIVALCSLGATFLFNYILKGGIL